MNWKEHIIIQILLLLAFFPIILSMGFIFSIIYIFFSVISSLLPDLDTKSKIDSIMNKNKMLFLIIFPVYFILSVPSIFYRKHRGVSHSIFNLASLLIAFIFLAYFLIPAKYLLLVGFAISFGYTSHLLSDALTVKGVSLLFPLRKWKLSGSLVSGKTTKKVFLVAFLVLLLFFFINLYIYFEVGYVSVKQVILYIVEYVMFWTIIYKIFGVKKYYESEFSLQVITLEDSAKG